MNTITKILIAEHSPSDIDLIQYELKKANIEFTSKIVETEKAYKLAINNFHPDIILSDFSLPSFDGQTAFKIREDFAPDIPFIFVSGSIGEEKSIAYIKNGVTDYVLKDKLFTLGVKVIRALKESKDNVQKKETEQKLIKSENLFRAIIENGTDMITLSTIEGKILYVSPSVYKVFGYKHNDINDRLAYDFIHPDDLNAFVEKRNNIVDIQGKSCTSELRLLHEKGNWIWCEATLTNMLQLPGINALVSNFRDVSGRKLMEKQREFEENNLDALINNTTDLMWSVDLNYKLITFNKPFYEIIKKYTGIELKKGANVFSVVLSDEQRHRFKISYDLAFTGESFTEIEYIDFPEETWSEISFYPISKGNKVKGTACHSRDITNIKKAEQQLSKSETRLKEAQAIGHISNWEIDLIKNTTTWSDQLYIIYGLNKEDTIPSTELFLSFIQPDDRKLVTQKIQESFKTLKPYSAYFRFSRTDGELRHGYTERIYEFDKNNNPIRIYGIMQDVTERKIAEEEKEKLLDRMIRHNYDLEQFTFIISHNLRSPTANILGVTDYLMDEKLNEEERQPLLQALSESASRLDTMMKDLNKILQVKRDSNEEKEIIQFSSIVKDVMLNIDNGLNTKKIDIALDFKEAEEIFSIKVYLQSIFYNLINNSIKYRKHDKILKIDISSHLDKDNIVLIFKDNGMGIDLIKYGDKVFGLYNRFHPHVEGKGMGLFMVKTQIESLGGKIEVKSDLDNGTEFRIELKK